MERKGGFLISLFTLQHINDRCNGNSYNHQILISSKKTAMKYVGENGSSSPNPSSTFNFSITAKQKFLDSSTVLRPPN